MMDTELLMEDQLWLSKMEASVLINASTWMRKIVFAVYDKAADSLTNIKHFRSEMYKTW